MTTQSKVKPYCFLRWVNQTRTRKGAVLVEPQKFIPDTVEHFHLHEMAYRSDLEERFVARGGTFTPKDPINIAS